MPIIGKEDETDQERHDRITKDLEELSNPKICITCGNQITSKHTLVTTAWGGFYHGAPLTCVEGRD